MQCLDIISSEEAKKCLEAWGVELGEEEVTKKIDELLLAREVRKRMKTTMESMIKNLYGVDLLNGCTEDEIDLVKQIFGNLPAVVEIFYRTVAKTECIHKIQDMWILPEHFTKWTWLDDPNCLIIMNENQGVCQAGIRREDLKMDDPPVYVKTDDNNWVLCAKTTSEFIMAMLGYQASFAMKYSFEDFLWINEEELEHIQRELDKLPFEVHNWIYDISVSLYSNSPDNIVAITDCGGDLHILYGASSKEGYEKLMLVMKGIGQVV